MGERKKISSSQNQGKVKIPEIDRRDFLKIGATAVGAGILSSTLGTKAPLFAAPLPAEYVDREVNSCCQFCQVRCTTRVQVKDGRVVNVYGNPENFWTGGPCVPKGNPWWN